MDRQLSSTRLCVFTALLAVTLVVSGSGIAAVLPGGPAAVSVDDGSAGVGVVSAQDANGTDDVNETDDANETRTIDDPINETDIDPRFQNVTVPVEDAEPFEPGTTVFVREETVLSMTFAAQPDEIVGSVSISESDSAAVEELSRNRTVHRAVDITVPESATDTPATLQMVVRSLPVANQSNLEVMRYNESAATWQPLNTTTVSNRTWSTDRGASVLLLEAETPGFSMFAVTETGTDGESAGDTETDVEPGGVNETDREDNEQADISPHPDATTVWINDRRPYEPGTTVLIREETVRAITFAADDETVDGIVAVNDSNRSALSTLRNERSVFRAVNITATEPARRTPATLHLLVPALPVEDRNNIEVMRYDETAGSWEALPTETVSKRTWSEDVQASVFRVEAETPGFSTFAMTEAPESDSGSEQQSDPEPESDSEPTDDTSDSESQNDGILFGIGLFEIAIALVVVAGGAGAVFVVRRR